MRLAPIDLIVAFLFPWLYAQALRHRRNVQLHARYMLVTVVPLIGPSLVRFLVNYVPGFTIDSLEELPRFGVALDLINGLTLIVMMALLWQDKRKGVSLLPIGIGGVGFSVYAFASIHWFGKTDSWINFSQTFAGFSVTALLVVGIAIGLFAGWWGWSRGGQTGSKAAQVATAES